MYAEIDTSTGVVTVRFSATDYASLLATIHPYEAIGDAVCEAVTLAEERV